MNEMKKVFDEEQKEVLVQELEKRIDFYRNHLEEHDEDEDTRNNRLFPLMWLQNLIKTNKIDRLTISVEEEDDIYC